MANRRVRLYEGPENSTIIGFSAGAIPSDKNSLHSFFNENGYEAHEYNESRYELHTDKNSEEINKVADRETIRALGSVSCWHIGIQPPLKDEHLPDFIGWCRTHVDTYHNSGFLIDNRVIPPYTPQSILPSDGIRLAEWF